MGFRVETPGRVRIWVYNQSGEEVAAILDQEMSPGAYRAAWNGRNSAGAMVGNALYFIRIETPSTQRVLRVLVLK